MEPRSNRRERPPASVLLVDLNNYARYPTLSIGYLVAALRRQGFSVEVLMPLNLGVPPVERERQETWHDHAVRRAYFSSHPLMALGHDAWRTQVSKRRHAPDPRVLAEVQRVFDRRRPDVLLLSAYADHFPSVMQLGELASRFDVPVLVGGPGFNDERMAAAWLGVPGLSAVVGAEVDLTLPSLVDAVLDPGSDLLDHPGVMLPDGRRSGAAPPLTSLEKLPTPDFSDFPWASYPNRVVPMMTGRGCDWGRCTFCSDVSTANGRTFRSRPVSAVLDELGDLTARHRTNDVIFLDIKLNSSLPMWHGLLDNFRMRVPEGHWIGTVHVASRGDNGLGAEELRSAFASGMRRITFGLETGSQRLNDRMAKGTSVDAMSRFICDAHAAGISVRTTMMLGYPGETSRDLQSTAAFLRRHQHFLDRVRMSYFKPVPGTKFAASYERAPDQQPGLVRLTWDYRYFRGRYRYAPAAARDYRRAKSEVLNLVYEINRRPVRDDARQFDGLM